MSKTTEKLPKYKILRSRLISVIRLQHIPFLHTFGRFYNVLWLVNQSLNLTGNRRWRRERRKGAIEDFGCVLFEVAGCE